MSVKRKTILFVMPRLPFPTSSGRKTSLYHYCRILSQELGYRLVVAAFLETGDNPDLKPNFIDRLVILPKVSAKQKILNIIKDSILLQKKPMQVALYWSKAAKNLIDSIICEEKPDIVIGDMVRSTEYIKDVNAFRISDLDDRISLRYQRQLENDIDGINPYGAFLSTMPSFLQKIALLKPIKILAIKNEIKLLAKYELEIGKICERTVFVAENEAKAFNSELGEEKAVAVPVGVDVEYFSYRKTGREGDTIGFLGAMNVAHNENAARHFITDIFPLVLKSTPNAKFMVIGGGVSESLRKMASDNVEFTGRVEDVRLYLERCKVFVCPLTFGSGIKTKNLEAMALGLPVVTSIIGAENINAVQNQDWIVADNDVDFANAVVNLLFDDEIRNKTGDRGSAFVNRNFTWDVAQKEWEKLLGENV